MKTLLRSSVAALAVLGLALSAQAAPEIGKAAPEFTLTDTHGKSHKLSDFKGKTVVLEWINLGCPFVKKHYESKNMQGLQKAYAGKDVVWLTICSSAPGEQGHYNAADWNAQIAKHGINAKALLLDEAGTVGRLYDAKVTPHMYVIDAKGVLVYNGAIDSISSAKQEDIAKAQNYVVAALDSVLAGKPVATTATRPYGCSVKYK